MNTREETTKDKVLILLAPEFDASETVTCLEKLRQASLPVCLVGMSAGLIKGKHGLTIQPDYTLEQLQLEQPIRLILIPGGQMCSASIMSDPRVHRLMQTTLASNNYVAAMRGAEPVLNGIGVVPTNNNGYFVSQGSQQIHEFAHHLIDLVTSTTVMAEAI